MRGGMSEAKLAEVFRASLGVGPAEFSDVLGPYLVPAWDSIGQMALVAELERAFEVVLEVDDILALINVAAAREILIRLGVEFGN